jgi:hypothetical protein
LASTALLLLLGRRLLVPWWRGKGAPPPHYIKGVPRGEMYNTPHEPFSTASSYDLLVHWPSLGRRPLPLSPSRGHPKGYVGDENYHCDTSSCCGVSGSVSKAVYFHILAGNGVLGVIMVAIRVRVCGGAAHAVSKSLLQDLHDLEVGYVIFIVNACAGA